MSIVRLFVTSTTGLPGCRQENKLLLLEWTEWSPLMLLLEWTLTWLLLEWSPLMLLLLELQMLLLFEWSQLGLMLLRLRHLPLFIGNLTNKSKYNVC